MNLLILCCISTDINNIHTSVEIAKRPSRAAITVTKQELLLVGETFRLPVGITNHESATVSNVRLHVSCDDNAAAGKLLFAPPHSATFTNDSTVILPDVSPEEHVESAVLVRCVRGPQNKGPHRADVRSHRAGVPVRDGDHLTAAVRQPPAAEIFVPRIAQRRVSVREACLTGRGWFCCILLSFEMRRRCRFCWERRICSWMGIRWNGCRRRRTPVIWRDCSWRKTRKRRRCGFCGSKTSVPRALPYQWVSKINRRVFWGRIKSQINQSINQSIYWKRPFIKGIIFPSNLFDHFFRGAWCWTLFKGGGGVQIKICLNVDFWWKFCFWRNIFFLILISFFVADKKILSNLFCSDFILRNGDL